MSHRWRFLFAMPLLAPLATAPAFADVKAGYEMWNKGDYFGAVKEWRPLAVAGDADAQFNMGQAYKLGRGVPADLKMAEGWYAKAAAQGHFAARDNYGLMLFQNGDRQAAMPYIEESAGRGEPRAQYVYGTALFNGDFAPKDWVRAYALMTRASASGVAAASASLAQMDKFIPVDQRQRGLELARAFEAAEAKPQMAQAGAPPVIGNEDLPPSKPASPPPAAPKPGAMPPAAAKPATLPPTVAKRIAALAKPVPKPAATTPVAPKPAPKPAPAVQTAAPAPSGNWKVQLGAFSDGAKAATLWTSLHKRIGALGPYRSSTAKAGAMTRLQAGPLASRAAAEKLCASVKAAGQPCIPVAP